jgi:hypothetical protein
MLIYQRVNDPFQLRLPSSEWDVPLGFSAPCCRSQPWDPDGKKNGPQRDVDHIDFI